jgi:hypothetical protein
MAPALTNVLSLKEHKNIMEGSMAKKGYLSLSRDEIITLLEWIPFQSNMVDETLELTNAIIHTHDLIDDTDILINCLPLTRDDCMLLIKWYEELPRKLLDRRDIDLHTVLCIHLAESIDRSR